MRKDAIITARIAQETLDRIDALAARMERPRAWIIQQAVERYVAEEAEFLDFLQEGIDSADRGELVSQEEMEAWFEQRRATRTQAAAE